METSEQGASYLVLYPFRLVPHMFGHGVGLLQSLVILLINRLILHLHLGGRSLTVLDFLMVLHPVLMYTPEHHTAKNTIHHIRAARR